MSDDDSAHSSLRVSLHAASLDKSDDESPRLLNTIDTVADEEALRASRELADSQNESRRRAREYIEEFNARRGELETRVDALRDAVDTLTLDNADERRRALASFMASFHATNPIIYKNLSSCCTSIAVLYAVKHFFLLLESELHSDGVEARHLVESRFAPNPVFLRELYIDIIHSLERAPGDPVKVLRYGDMLHPNEDNFLAFEKFVDAPTQKWLVESARSMLGDLEGRRNELTGVEGYSDEALGQYRDFLATIAKGGLPWDYYGEQELDDPRETLHYVRMLDPATEHEFDKTLTFAHFRVLQERAAVRVEQYRQLPDTVLASLQPTIDHLQSIVDGKPPFGYRLVEQKGSSVFDQPAADDENEEEATK